MPPAVGQFSHDAGNRALFESAFGFVHNGGGGSSDACDVLQKEAPRTAIVCNSQDFKKKPRSGTVEPSPAASDGQVLARESGNDAIHFSMPGASVKGGNVGPDRCRIQ
jgi:hypothetical protein